MPSSLKSGASCLPDLPLARGARLRLDRPLVMAIVNATPDSFSDGGRLPEGDALTSHVQSLIADGADILDVGGESTRPGHMPVAADEEIRRILPAIQAIRKIDREIPISIDTRKAAVAQAALDAGASFVNDVSGLDDPHMGAIVREAGCAVVLMRNRPLMGDVAQACRAELAYLVQRARAASLSDSQLVLDPGIGFGEPPGADPQAMLQLLRGVAEYSQGFPVLVGASRKRAVGALSGEADAGERLGGSLAAALLAVQAGARIVRVHDVKATAQALRVWTA